MSEGAMSTINPGDTVQVIEAWMDSRQPDLYLGKGTIHKVRARMGNTVSLVGSPHNAWYFTSHFEKLVPEGLVPLSETVLELAQAMLATRERLGESVMPAKDGWAWYDALKKHAPELLPKGQCLAVLRRDRRTAFGEVWVRCEKDKGHDDRQHRSGAVGWGDRSVGASYLVEGTND